MLGHRFVFILSLSISRGVFFSDVFARIALRAILAKTLKETLLCWCWGREIMSFLGKTFSTLQKKCKKSARLGYNDHVSGSAYSFSRSCPKTVSITREVFPTGSTTLLRLQLWHTRDCAHRSRYVGVFCFNFGGKGAWPKWAERVTLQPLALFKPGLTILNTLYVAGNAHGWLRVAGICFWRPFEMECRGMGLSRFLSVEETTR